MNLRMNLVILNFRKKKNREGREIRIKWGRRNLGTESKGENKKIGVKGGGNE